MIPDHKKLLRLYREENLRVRRRGGRKRALGTHAMGYETGISLDKLLQVRAILADALPGEPLYGFTPEAGLPLGLETRSVA